MNVDGLTDIDPTHLVHVRLTEESNVVPALLERWNVLLPDVGQLFGATSQSHAAQQSSVDGCGRGVHTGNGTAVT